jgi:hypothetical protein
MPPGLGLRHVFFSTWQAEAGRDSTTPAKVSRGTLGPTKPYALTSRTDPWPRLAPTASPECAAPSEESTWPKHRRLLSMTRSRHQGVPSRHDIQSGSAAASEDAPHPRRLTHNTELPETVARRYAPARCRSASSPRATLRCDGRAPKDRPHERRKAGGARAAAAGSATSETSWRAVRALEQAVGSARPQLGFSTLLRTRRAIGFRVAASSAQELVAVTPRSDWPT